MAEVTMDNYIAVAPGAYSGSGYYGVGDTVDEAKANLKKVGGNLRRVIVWELPRGVHSAYVSDFGEIRWTWVSEEFREAWDRNDLPVAYARGTKGAGAA